MMVEVSEFKKFYELFSKFDKIFEEILGKFRNFFFNLRKFREILKNLRKLRRKTEDSSLLKIWGSLKKPLGNSEIILRKILIQYGKNFVNFEKECLCGNVKKIW